MSSKVIDQSVGMAARGKESSRETKNNLAMEWKQREERQIGMTRALREQ